jgi:hypothetical protein
MNAIQQISLKLQLGIDPASKIQPEELQKKWQAYRNRTCQSYILSRKNGDKLVSSSQNAH